MIPYRTIWVELKGVSMGRVLRVWHEKYIRTL